MKFVDEYRAAETLLRPLSELKRQITRRWVIMDVCGGQTHSLLRNGLEAVLEDQLELVHGPGCPVCVTPAEVIDDAIELAIRHDIILTSFGDMLRVPGRKQSLSAARSGGADVRAVYSPFDAVQLARKEPGRQLVFLGVGFETTAPATALAVIQARQLGLTNFSLLSHHVRVEPAMRALMYLPENRVQGFLAAGHVCAVTGYQHFEPFATEFQVPVIVTGFEPLDLLMGLTECVRALEENRHQVLNQYPRAVQSEGNVHARRIIEQVYEISTVPWRGFGLVPDGGLVIRSEWCEFDARRRFGLPSVSTTDDGDCQSAAIMAGRLKPPQCPLFGNRCTPQTPVGAPMVSSEGACAAYFRYVPTVEMTHE